MQRNTEGSLMVDCVSMTLAMTVVCLTGCRRPESPPVDTETALQTIVNAESVLRPWCEQEPFIRQVFYSPRRKWVAVSDSVETEEWDYHLRVFETADGSLVLDIPVHYVALEVGWLEDRIIVMFSCGSPCHDAAVYDLNTGDFEYQVTSCHNEIQGRGILSWFPPPFIDPNRIEFYDIQTGTISVMKFSEESFPRFYGILDHHLVALMDDGSYRSISVRPLSSAR